MGMIYLRGKTYWVEITGTASPTGKAVIRGKKPMPRQC